MRAIKIKSLFVPRYTEVALFLMSFTFLLLFATNPDLRQGLYQYVIDDLPDPRMVLVVILVFLGIIFSIYHAFSSKKKTKFEKNIMLFFAITTSGAAGVSVGIYLFSSGTQGFMLIFPIWNIVNAFILFALYRKNVINENSISDTHAKLSEIIIGSIVVFLIFLIAQFIYELYWAIVFSICIGYAMTFNESFSKLFLLTPSDE